MDKDERYNRYTYTMGLSAWEITSYTNPYAIIIVNDGPSGLRKPISNDFTDQKETVVSVCLPTPSALAASFDERICEQNGSILAKECIVNGTDVLLAPGVNIKHYVLCGRNFEYFSEDPFLAGKLAACYINGLENNGVGSCIKHYAANSQEHARLINSSEMSLRALNEIYLRVFNYALKYSSPSCLMTSYNRINGEYVNESSYLLQKKLRQEYHFDGLIMSDWCAVNHKGNTIRSGLNIEMPISKRTKEQIEQQFINGTFDENDLVKRDEETAKIIHKIKSKTKPVVENDLDVWHKEAVAIANETMVLVKNDNHYLPFKANKKLLVIGYFANHSRFVGGGSGWVNAYKKPSFCDILDKKRIEYTYVPGYDENKTLTSKEELKKYAKDYDQVLLFLGQYQKDESEGYDRTSIDFADVQIDILKNVAETFTSFATVIITGSVMNMQPVLKYSTASMICYLAGEGQSEAIYNNLFGIHNPCGRLPETWISSLNQNPIIAEYQRRDIYHTYYHDDIFVGYRYYDMQECGFYLPFGYGLSYSSFIWNNFLVKNNDKTINIHLEVQNIGDFDGSDIVQIYVGKKDSAIYRPIKELKGFAKLFVKTKAKDSIDIAIDIDDLAVYETESDNMVVEDGIYQIYIAKNTQEIIYTTEVFIKGKSLHGEDKPRSLIKKDVPDQYTLSTPCGVLFYNNRFKEYVKKHQLPFELNDFEKKYWYIHAMPLRELTYQHDIDFVQLIDLIDYLNQDKEHLSREINFDRIIENFNK